MKILIVDDSLVYRHVVAKTLEDEGDLEVVGSVRNGVKAMEFIARQRPDLVTLDMEMPEMDGLQTLGEIQKLNLGKPRREQIGVIVVSAFTQEGGALTVRALEAGAFDYVPKPMAESEEQNILQLKSKLIPLIRVYAESLRRKGVITPGRRISHDGSAAVGITPRRPQRPVARTQLPGAREAVCIGVSTGGPRALHDMLPELCRVTELPIFVVQHMPANFTASLAANLARKCAAEVKEADDGEIVRPRTVYLAPGGRHLLLARDKQDRLTMRLSDAPPENGCRPSVDVLFRSAAATCHGRLVAVVLTGMGNDGEKSLRMLKREGAYIIAQDEETSVVWGMPGSAVETGCVDRVVPLMNVPVVIRRVLAGGATS